MSDASPPLPPTICGRWVVIGMFGFAVAASLLLWVYRDRDSAPFRPLQRALLEEFPGSQPRVKGGRKKLHQQTPLLLWMGLRIDFDPIGDPERAERFADRVVEAAGRHHDLSPYDQLEIHLFWPEPEREIRRTTITRSALAALQDGASR